MRKQKTPIWIMMALILLLVLSACGQSATTNTTTADSANAALETESKMDSDAVASPETNATADEELVTYQSDAGEVQVPKNPQRIVDLTSFSTGYFVALDAPVVGALSGAMNNKYIKDQLAAAGTSDLGEVPTPEKLISLKPDLFIVYTGTEGIDKLEQIAPVVQITFGKRDFKDLMLENG